MKELPISLTVWCSAVHST